MNLYTDISKHLADPAVVAVIMEGELQPTGGPNAVVAPPTYIQGANGSAFAAADDARIPEQDSSGWFHGVRMGTDGPVRGKQVVVNSVQAAAHASGTALYQQQARLGVTLPAFQIRGAQNEVVDKQVKKHAGSSQNIAQQIRDALAIEVSNWELPHRTADAWLKYADDGNGQIWSQEDNELKRTLMALSHENGALVYRYAPGNAPFGYWLSHGVAQRHAIPRAYSCEITGYAADEVKRGATKQDPMGGTLRATRVDVSGGLLSVTGKTGTEPSKLGFGQVPAEPTVKGFRFDLILRQATISLKALDLFQFDNSDQAFAAKRVFVLLAMAGHLLASENGFLRSSCDLVTIEERWGWRRHGQRSPEDFSVPTVEEVGAALREAIAAAEKVGLHFEQPIPLWLSEAEAELIAKRVATDADKGPQE